MMAEASSFSFSFDDVASITSQPQHPDTLLLSSLPQFTQPLNPILSNPAFWTSAVLLAIVGLLVAWEALIEEAKECTPKAIATVIDNILIKMGSLGFIGLVLSAALNNPISSLQTVVGSLSEQYLGDEELLLESFEFIHELFFQAAIVFFASAAFMTLRVIDSIEFASDIAEEKLVRMKQQRTGDKKFDEDDLAFEDYEVMLVEQEEARERESDNILLRELSMSLVERGTEALIIRERLQKEMNLPEFFRLDKDLEEAFATKEFNLIEIQPVSWLPLIPVLAIAASVDLSHDVANPGSPQAIVSSGFFLATPGVLVPLLVLQIVKFVWGLFNFSKVSIIKEQLIPRIKFEIDSDDVCQKVVIPPAVESAQQRRDFSSTPWFARAIEASFGAPPTNRVQELFGTIGGNGVEFYLESIKFHTWICVTTIVAFTAQILPRDIYALVSDADNVGLPDLLVPELLVYGGFAVMNILLLLYVAPVTFVNYALVSCVERAVERNAGRATDDVLSSL